MTKAERGRKRLLYLAAVLYFFAGYYFCQWVNSQRYEYWTIFLPDEERLPFVPFAIFGYLLSYGSVAIIYFVTSDYNHFVRTWRNFAALTTVHYVFFLFLPVKMARPEMDVASGVSELVVRVIFLVDQPLNVFPSLHVAYPFLGALLLWNFKRGWSYVFFSLAIATMVAVVFVKQHYILDVIGGLLTAILVFRTTCPTGGWPFRSGRSF